MTTDQGGIRTPKKNANRTCHTYQPTKKQDLNYRINEIFKHGSRDASNHIYERKVREIVTINGQRPRGNFPSRKGILLEYESLLEENVLRVLEIASCVLTVETQPCVFKFFSGHESFRYTPDVRAKILGEDYYIEVKPKLFAKNPRIKKRLHDVIFQMHKNNLRFFIITDEDARGDGLEEKLKHLLAKRPRPGRHVPDRDPNVWDTENLELKNSELTSQWINAQKLCNELLDRVMRRDPDELFFAN